MQPLAFDGGRNGWPRPFSNSIRRQRLCLARFRCLVKIHENIIFHCVSTHGCLHGKPFRDYTRERWIWDYFIITLNDITLLRKLRVSSSLKPKPILRIGIDEHAALASQFSKT
jgi:hypothetical protein